MLVSKDRWLVHVYLVAMKKGAWNGLAEEENNAVLRATVNGARHKRCQIAMHQLNHQQIDGYENGAPD